MAGAVVEVFDDMKLEKLPAHYLLLRPVSTTPFIYTLLRSMVLTLLNDGIEWRGTKYPLEELREGMV